MENIEHAQSLIDEVETRIRTMAERAGITRAEYPIAAREFARMIGPECGKGEIRLSKFRHWWKGYAAGLRIARGERS